jgi:large subunit ribosomal protein L35
MPKIKSHKGASKRFRVTGTGKVVRGKAWRGHHLDIKSSRRTRRYAGKAVLSPTSEEQVRHMLPYLKG